MFASLKFRDEFSFPALGLLPQNRATGSFAGAAIPVAAALATSAGPAGNYANFKKWIAIVLTGSGAAGSMINAWWGGASASGGTFSMLPASSTGTYSGSTPYIAGASASAPGTYGSAAAIVMEIRGEYINGLNQGITWIAPIVSVGGASAYAAAVVFAFDSGSDQASLYDQTGFVLAETDSF